MPNNYTLYKNSFTSTDGSSKISGFMCIPNHKTPRCVVQIVSQLGKSFADYETLTEYLTSNGYVVCVHDHLSTGESLTDGDVKGYFGEEYGKKILVDDTRRMTALIRENIEGLPVVMAGEGTGAAIAETLISEEGHTADGYLLIDPIRANKFIKKLRRISKRRSRFSGGKKRGKRISRKIERNNKRVSKRGRVDFGSLSRLNFLTYRGFYDVFSLVCNLSKLKEDVYGKKDIPIFIINRYYDADKYCHTRSKEAYKHYMNKSFTDVRMILSNTTIENDATLTQLLNWLDERNF